MSRHQGCACLFESSFSGAFLDVLIKQVAHYRPTASNPSYLLAVDHASFSVLLQVEPQVGGRFSIFGGSVLATFTKLEAQLICLDWRFTSWHEKDMSKVRPEHTSTSLLATASEAFVWPCTHQQMTRQQAHNQQQALRLIKPVVPMSRQAVSERHM